MANNNLALADMLVPGKLTPKIQGLLGKRFGRWTTIDYAGRKATRSCVSYFIKAVCDCRSVGLVNVNDLVSGASRSCGCLRNEMCSARVRKHGMAIHGKTRGKEYRSWQAMLRRCYDPKNIGAKHYSEHGITVYEPWQHDFMAFYNHIGPATSPKHTVDRFPNEEGNYEPGNVRWATSKQQNNNRTSTVFVVLDGERMSFKEAAAKVGVNYRTALTRKNAGGKSIMQALGLEP